MGWGIVERFGTKCAYVAHGVIEPKGDLPDRLVQIETALVRMVGEHNVDAAGIESIFFHKDAQAAAKLGHARGVAMLVLARARVPIFEYAPALVKKSICGSGRADKSQVAKIVHMMLRIPGTLRSDETDALAIALVHAQRSLGHRSFPPPPRSSSDAIGTTLPSMPKPSMTPQTAQLYEALKKKRKSSKSEDNHLVNRSRKSFV